MNYDPPEYAYCDTCYIQYDQELINEYTCEWCAEGKVEDVKSEQS
jgi:hypothetical protein